MNDIRCTCGSENVNVSANKRGALVGKCADCGRWGNYGKQGEAGSGGSKKKGPSKGKKVITKKEASGGKKPPPANRNKPVTGKSDGGPRGAVKPPLGNPPSPERFTLEKLKSAVRSILEL